MVNQHGHERWFFMSSVRTSCLSIGQSALFQYLTETVTKFNVTLALGTLRKLFHRIETRAILLQLWQLGSLRFLVSDVWAIRPGCWGTDAGEPAADGGAAAGGWATGTDLGAALIWGMQLAERAMQEARLQLPLAILTALLSDINRCMTLVDSLHVNLVHFLDLFLGILL